MKTAAPGSTYVDISREEIEAWLNTIGFHGKWKLADGRAGVYLLTLSPTVAIKFSSTVASHDATMSYANASMQLSLISTVTGQCLNKKAQGQSHFKRTKGWKETWKEGIKRMKEAYIKAASFYDAISRIKDREEYKRGTLELIKTAPGWETNDFLQDLYARVEHGTILTQKQEDTLAKFIRQDIKESHQHPHSDDVEGNEEEETRKRELTEKLLTPLRALYAAARAKDDKWTMEFTQSIANLTKSHRNPSEKQEQILLDKFQSYRVDPGEWGNVE